MSEATTTATTTKANASTGDAREEAGGPYAVSLLTSPRDWDDPALRARWGELVEASENVNAIYASPVWFDLLRERHGADALALAVARGRGGEVAGVVPVLFKEYPFQFYVSRRPVYTTRLRAAHVLGSVPALPDDPAAHRRLYETLLKARVDCVYLDAVPVESPCWEFLGGALRGDFLVYAPGGPRPWHLLRLPPGGTAVYLSEMSSKARYNLRRSAKQLAESGGGQLALLRADSEASADEFLEGATRVSRNTWQHDVLGTRAGGDGAAEEEEREWTRRLARAGLLRSYLLSCGERPCAFVVGQQFGEAFQYVEIGYDREFAQYSPGTVLLHMLIQDLCDHRPPALLNFGTGDADYKRRFGNVRRTDLSALVMRRTLRNRLLVGSHGAFRSLVRKARELVRGRRPE